MSAQNTPKDRINILKKRARKISKKLSIPQADALALIAKEEGYDSWFSCSNAIKNGASITQEPSANSGNQLPKHKHRLTLLDYSGDDFASANSLRNRLEDEIKDSLQRGKGSLLRVKLYLSPNQISQINEPDSFFEAILNRFTNLQGIELHESDPFESPLNEVLINPEAYITGE